jgi:hypothetical protein
VSNTSTPSRSLVIAAAPSQPKLSAKQKEFNKLVARVEKLRAQVTATAAEFDACLNHYVTDLRPIEVETNLARAAVVRAAYPFWVQKTGFTPKQHQQLGDMLVAFIEELIAQAGDAALDAELVAIHQSLEGDSYKTPTERAADEQRQDVEAMRNMLEDMAAQYGMPVDFSSLPADPTPADFARILGNLSPGGGPGSAPKERPRSAKAKEKAAAQAAARQQHEQDVRNAKARGVAGIYKQLARLLHPDLEQDPAAKLKKEALMKQVTMAYQANDLHALLTLELAWLHGEGHDVSKLTDAQLAVYNEVLRDQVEELEIERVHIFAHPRYAPLRSFFDDPKQVKFKKMKPLAGVANAIRDFICGAVTKLATKQAKVHLKVLVSDWAYVQQIDAHYAEHDHDFL